ncbi:glycoside hydrolase [Pseudomonas baetica]|uniref:WD40/YVTN/BNR-like repeat-containing protein n=1 Tax=Pseudomonas baetica TaxID=674054 RepID=UPI001C8CED55|nr:sialidase family protein [Pseudomonas baetica]MBX9406028.1 glycoside hydrolase [Pseudomonas baetica]
MAVPVISNLPPAPTRADGSADFSSKADALAGALQPMVVQVNIATQWMAGQLTEAQAQAAAAAASALAAANSATAANASKNAAAQSAIDATNNGAAQVALAANQVTLAVSAKNSAEAAAAAAGAAAGLPSLVGNAYRVLRVTANGLAVEWGLGLPVLPGVGGAPGKVLTIAPNGTSLAWAEPFQVGDIFTGARNPGALWLPADGSIRLQSAYPALFAAVGLVGNSIGSNWQTISVPVQPNNVASGVNGTSLFITSTGTVYRSTDKGATWVAGTATGITPVALATNGAGLWLAIPSYGTGKRSTDDGLTWSDITVPTISGGVNKLAYAGGNVFIATSGAANTTVLVSTNNGTAWTPTAHGGGSIGITAIGSDEAGIVIISSSTTLRRSTDYGQTWAALTAPASGIAAIATNKMGTWLIGGTNGNTNTYLSTNNGAGFALVPMGTTAGANAIIAMEGAFFVSFGGSTTQYVYKDSVFSPVITSQNMPIIAHAGSNIIIAPSTNAIYRGLPYSYDPATQFQLPAMPIVQGVKSYIKALGASA